MSGKKSRLRKVQTLTLALKFLYPCFIMTSSVLILILTATTFTAFISGIFGMAGGLMLMGILLSVLPLAPAMILHGAIQSVANGWRACLLRQHIRWDIAWRYSFGAITGAALFLLISWRPDRQTVFLLLGLSAFLVWVPVPQNGRGAKNQGLESPAQAELCGVIVQSLNICAGAAGPLFDLFFTRTEMNRQQIVATKSLVQTLTHILKIIAWGTLLSASAEWQAMGPQAGLLLAAIPLAMIGTWLGGHVLASMSEQGFQLWTRWLISAIGLVYLARGLL